MIDTTLVIKINEYKFYNKKPFIKIYYERWGVKKSSRPIYKEWQLLQWLNNNSISGGIDLQVFENCNIKMIKDSYEYIKLKYS